MPKIINASRESIIEVTKKMLDNHDYELINCRDIAKEAGIGVGTLYHFFKSKNDILSAIILEDWLTCISIMNTENTLSEGIKVIYVSLYDFSKKYVGFWDYVKSNSTDYVSHLSKHEMLVGKIKEKIVELYNYNNANIDNDIIDFLGETIINLSIHVYEYSRVEKIFNRIIGGNN